VGGDRDSHRSDRHGSEDEAEGEQGHGAERDRAIIARSTGVVNETVLMIVVLRAGHAPRERWADRVKGL
jgi:hypothetical protein